MNNKINYTVFPSVDFESGNIVLTESFNGFHDKYVKLVIQTREEAVRKCLIALGWTPPQDLNQTRTCSKAGDEGSKLSCD